jgi:hypothetical protein
MSRPVYYIKTETRDYTFITKDPWLLEFRCAPKDMAMFRKPRAFISTRTGGFQMTIDKVSVVPGPPVNGELLIRVAGKRM